MCEVAYRLLDLHVEDEDDDGYNKDSTILRDPFD